MDNIITNTDSRVRERSLTKFDPKSSLSKILGLAMIFVAFLSYNNATGQSTTLNTTIGSTGYTANNSSGTNGFITFVIDNTSSIPIILTDVGNWVSTSHNGTTSTLWYSATSLSGTVGALAGPTWTIAGTEVVSGVTGTGVAPVIQGMTFQIPANTRYRFALHTTGTNTYSGTGSVGNASPNNFTNAVTGVGVILYTGNYQIGGQFIGYGMTNRPRYFTGFVTFEPAITAPDNAGIDEVTSPNMPFCAGNYPVKVQIKNSGTATLNNVQINWELDGVLQTPIAYSTPLASTATTEVTLSNSELFTTTPRTIKAWTSLPNGMADTVNTDDTVDVVRAAALSGTYTIGTGGDFPNVVAAADVLNQYGVCGPVTMNILTGTYTGQVTLEDIIGTSATNTVTFQSQTGNPSDVVISFAPVGIDYVLQFDKTEYTTFKNLTISSTTLNQGIVVRINDDASFNTIENCIINNSGPSSTGQNAGIYAENIGGSNNVIRNNTVNGGYFGIYITGKGTAVADLTSNHIVEGNKVNDAYFYGAYFYYTNNLKVRNNTIKSLNSNVTNYGLFSYYSDNALEIIGNEIVLTGNTGTKYGMMLYYNDGTNANQGIVGNNTIAIDCPGAESYGMYCYYTKYQNYVNNSVSVYSNDALSNAARFYFTSTTYSDNNVVNNAFSNVTGDGYTLYLYNGQYNNYWDYNNIHSGQNRLVETISPAAKFDSLKSWSAAYNMDQHSISYDPGFVSTTDLHVDKYSPASWSLNGRGLHIATNNRDKENNVRVVNRADGVPDIGAYEFTPEVAAPIAVATPSTAERGETQVYSFGQQDVLTVKWGNNAPVGDLRVQQYSGEKGNGVVAAANPAGTMYFHTDISTQGSVLGLDMDFTLNYHDIWLGDVATEANLRLAHKIGSASWSVYNGGLSNVTTTTNLLDAQVYSLGSYTGLENNSVASAFVIPQGKVVICYGGQTILSAEPQNGNYYKWYYNGTAITGAEGPSVKSYSATQAGNYSVQITQGGKVVESGALVISAIAAPNAVIGANGPLTYCSGNGLTLNAGNVNGVTYQWQLDGINIPGATSKTYPVTQSGQYTVVAENIACSAVSTPTAVAAGPLVVNLGNDTTYCEQKNIFATLDAGFPGAKYLWSTGETTKTIEPKQSGDYWVEVDGGTNCVDRDTLKVTINNLPEAQGISFVQNGNSYQFFASGTVGVTGYMWLFSDGTTSTQQQPVRTIKNDDLYVRLVVFNACGTDTLQLGWPLTVGNVITEDGISIYPNPASDNITVNIDGDINLQSLTIINALGAEVAKIDNVQATKHTVDVSNLPAGNYILNAQTADGVVSKKFNIVR